MVRRTDGTLAVGRNLPGRGAWLCRDSPGCLEAAVRRQALPRALRGPVAPESLAALGRWLSGEATGEVCEDGVSARAPGPPPEEERT